MPVVCNLFAGFILTPYLIRRLGDDRFGLWGLAFSYLEYAVLFDMGLRTAVVNQSSRMQALGERGAINEVINTALFYFVTIGLLLMAAFAFGHGWAHEFFRVKTQYASEFDDLMLLVGFGLALSLVASSFGATLEALGEFRRVNQNQVSMMILRVVLTAGLLYFGYGLRAIGLAAVGTQLGTYALNLLSLKAVFTDLRISPTLARWSRFRSMALFGFDSLLANVAGVFLSQAPLSMIKRRGVAEAFVGYYSAPLRLLAYAAEGITRIGFVTSPSTAAMEARGEREKLAQMGINLNRYCFALFMPFSLFLWFWGEPLLGKWLGPGFREFGAPLLFPFIVAHAFALAGQFNSSSMLFGLAKQRAYAIILIVEAVLLGIGIPLVLPRFGLEGVAYLASGLMILARGLATPVALCHYLHYSFARYWISIHARPLLATVPVAVVCWLLKNYGLTGQSWGELFGALALTGTLYTVVAFRVVANDEHRRMVADIARRRLGWAGGI